MLGQGCYVASHPVEREAALNTQKTKWEPAAAPNIQKTKRVLGQMILA